MDAESHVFLADDDCSQDERTVAEKFGNGCSTALTQCCSVKTLKNRVPILKWIPKYSLDMLSKDFIAGVTVGLTAIPQGMAYGSLAGLPLQVTLLFNCIAVDVLLAAETHLQRQDCVDFMAIYVSFQV